MNIKQALIPSALGLAAGVALGLATAPTQSAPASVTPQACGVRYVAGHQDATVVVLGDAGWYWLPGTTGYHEYVCANGQDGPVLVPMSDYGKPVPSVDPAAYTRPAGTVTVSLRRAS